MKNLLLYILIIFIMISAGTTAKASAFNDICESDWFYEDISILEGKGIINGFSDGSFRPEDFVTFEQFIKMIITALQIEIPLNDDDWSLPYIEKAIELHLIQTSEKDLEKDISRGDMAKTLSNVLDYLNESVSIEYNDLHDLPAMTPDEYIDDILRLYNSGIITGFSDHTFRYEEKMTRAQACAVLNRLITPNKRQKPMTMSSYGHGSACPYFKKDLGEFHEIINRFETGTDYHIDEIIRTLSGDGGYLVIEYRRLTGFNLIMVEYFENKKYSYKEEYSMFTLYLYDGSPGYPEKEWGYDTMFSKLQIKSLAPLKLDAESTVTSSETFYEYKVRSLLCCIFGKETGKTIGNYVIGKCLDNQSDSIEIKENDRVRTIFFTNGSQTVKNFTFTRLE